jgi:hypothetical protein
MRTTTLFPGVLGVTALVVSIGACKWTEFDDLEKDSWVSVTAKPNGDSTDYGVAIQRGSLMASTGAGGKLVAIGAGQAQYTEIEYTSGGDADLAPTALKLNNQFGVGNLDPQPILLADPTSDEVALITNAGGQSIAVLSGVGGLVAHQVFGPEQPDAAAYMLAPPRLDTMAVHPSQPVVASGDSIYGTFYMAAPPTQPKCQLLDDTGMPMQIRGVGGAQITETGAMATDDIVVWGAAGTTGKLLLYSGGLFNGAAPPNGIGTCIDGTTNGVSRPLPMSVAVNTDFVPGKGSQILMIDRRYAVLVGRKDAEGYLAIYDVTTMTGGMLTPTRLSVPITLPDLRTAAILDTGAAKFVVAGYPGSTVENVRAAGKVLVFPLDLTTGIDPNYVLTLHDAQPEGDQAFGRAVAVTPFNGSNVIAVGADNEVFLYFRTTIYDDTRQ